VRTIHRLLPAALLLTTASSTSLLSCASKTGTGAAVGAAGGAVVGGVIGKAAGSTAKGAIIGAVVGGAAGAIIGSQMDKQAKEMEQNIKGAKVERVGEGIQVTFESGLLYDFGSDVVRPEAKANLRELAASLDSTPIPTCSSWVTPINSVPPPTTRVCRSGAPARRPATWAPRT